MRDLGSASFLCALLQGAHMACRLVGRSSPPFERGMMWSIDSVAAVSGLSQAKHVRP